MGEMGVCVETSNTLVKRWNSSTERCTCAGGERRGGELVGRC